MANNIIDSIQLSGVTYDIQGSGGGGKAIEAGRGISITTGETADTVSFSLPISAGTGTNSIIENTNTSASGSSSHAEGYNTHANGNYSHAEGSNTHANGTFSHAEGNNTHANGSSSHAEGNNTTANGRYSHAEGYYTETKNQSEHASGQFNVSNSATTTFGDSGNTLFSVGNGSIDASHNAFEIRQNGDIYLTSGGTDIKLQDHLGGGGGSSYTAGDGIDITNNVISVTGKVDTSTYNTFTAATDTALASKADTATTYTKTETDNLVTAATSTKQDTLVSGTNIKTINNESLLGSGNIDIQGSGNPTVELTQAEYDALVSAGTVSADTYYIITDAEAGDLTNYYTKSETNTLLGGKADTATTYTKTEVDNAITAATSTKQDTLVSGTNIKTINNESILGSGNIDIQGGGGGKAIEAGTNISVTTGATADTINCTLPITAGTNANGQGIIIGDNECTATGKYAIAIGHNADVNGNSSIVIGNNTTVTGSECIVAGRGNNYNGSNCISVGAYNNIPSSNIGNSALFGKYLGVKNSNEAAFGEYNVSSSGSTNADNTVLTIGNGYHYQSTNVDHNILDIRKSGDIYVADTNDTTYQNYYEKPMKKLQDYLQIKVVKLTQSAYDALSPNYDSNTLYIIKD